MLLNYAKDYILGDECANEIEATKSKKEISESLDNMQKNIERGIRGIELF